MREDGTRVLSGTALRLRDGLRGKVSLEPGTVRPTSAPVDPQDLGTVPGNDRTDAPLLGRRLSNPLKVNVTSGTHPSSGCPVRPVKDTRPLCVSGVCKGPTTGVSRAGVWTRASQENQCR